jgi:hypothetical protein
MNSDDIQKYLDLMGEIKRRTAVIDAFSAGLTHAVYKATTIESIYLQYRKILELIALGSLVAQKDVFSTVYADFAKYWNAELLVKDIERLNPNFYPEPIIQQPSTRPDTKMDFILRKDDFLTRDDLIKLYKKCGAIMHSGNPYGSQVDYGYYEKMSGHWRERIVNLLNAHRIRLIDDPNLYLVQMGAPDAPPTHTTFVLASRPPP